MRRAMKGERGKKQRMNTHTQSLTYTEGVVGLKSTTAGDVWRLVLPAASNSMDGNMTQSFLQGGSAYSFCSQWSDK